MAIVSLPGVCSFRASLAQASAEALVAAAEEAALVAAGVDVEVAAEF